jgi:parvulin-like peptidyl-prolyl isomerase
MASRNGVASRWSRRRTRWTLIAAGVCVVAVCLAIKQFWPIDSASAQGTAQPALPRLGDRPASRTSAATATEPPRVAAMVNGEEITRQDLARECMARYGGDVLESLINKHLIAEYCRSRGITVTRQQVNAEIARLAQRFSMSVEQWLRLLEKERNITPEQYAEDILWPTLALREAAKDLLRVTEEELRAAYEAKYGPAVQARIIVLRDADQAHKVRAAAVQNPADFARLARQYSEDASAGHGGMIPAIRRHLGDERLEQAAFALQPGQISPVIEIDKQYVIVKCEGLEPSLMKEFPLEQVRGELEQMVLEKKEPMAAGQVFRKLQEKAQVVKVYGDAQLAQQHPGVAAIVAGRTIALTDLGEECIRRHGREVLEGLISRRVLLQQVRKYGLKITQQDLDLEIYRAAEAMGVVDENDQPQVDRWLRLVEEQQGLSYERYLTEVVWPTVALKMLTHHLAGDRIDVTDDDIQKGYEANYGPRADCLAIVLNNQRTAIEVWEMARKNLNPVYFGQLAHKYSVDKVSRELAGEVPPIQRHGGRPQLEREAFALKAGEMSGIIQVEDKFVILYCRGFTQPREIPLEEVRDTLYRDLYEKKLRTEMARQYHQLMDAARIQNFLAQPVPVTQATHTTPGSPAAR